MKAERGVDGSEAQAAVLEAAGRMLETVPLSELSVSRLIGEAGISRATFYFYFSSKFAVIAALVTHLVAELQVAFEGGQATRRIELERSIDARLRDAAKLWRRNRALLHAVAENWHSVPELRMLWLEVVDELTELVAAEACRIRPTADPNALRPLAATLAWAIERYLYVAGMGIYPDVRDESAALPAIKQMWLGVLLGPRLVDDLGECHTRQEDDQTG